MNNGFLEGAIDLHVHSSPDVDPRRFDDIDLAKEAARVGMAALLIKSHQNSTVERAFLVSRVVPNICVYGGLVLNDTVGGLNPQAVRLAIDLGAREIWMPTRSAKNHRRHHKLPGGVSICNGDGTLKPETSEILDMLAESNCILGTGHLSPEEGVLLVGEARKRGVTKILVTHPEWSATFYPIALQRELTAAGDVFFERCFVSTTHRCGHTPISTIANAVADVGVETTVLSTDLGQPDTPTPVDGLTKYAECLLGLGFDKDGLATDDGS